MSGQPGGPLRITTPASVMIFLSNDNRDPTLTYQLMATGGAPPYSWRYSPNSPERLPDGTTLASDGVLSGCFGNDLEYWNELFIVNDRSGLEAAIAVELKISCQE